MLMGATNIPPAITLPFLPMQAGQVGQTASRQQGCRRRVVAPHSARPVRPNPTGSAPRRRMSLSRTLVVFAPGVFFLAAMLFYIVTALVCIALPPQPTVVFGTDDMHRIPASAHCIRVTRYADYVVAEVAIGSPMRVMNVLLNLNEVTSEIALLIHSTRVSESATISCNGYLCTDTALLHVGGPVGAQERVVASFLYANPTTLSSSMSYLMSLDGEMKLNYNVDYFLTGSHMCWADYSDLATPIAPSDAKETTGLKLHVIDGELCSNATTVVAYGGALANSPAVKKVASGCGITNDTVVLFPEQASNEAAWLVIQNSQLYENAPEDVKKRRNVVEAGTECAKIEFPHSYSLFEMDCRSIYASCETLASVPFRRAATQAIRIRIGENGTHAGTMPVMWTANDVRLHNLPRLGENAVVTSLIKLTLMLLTALVIWVRANKITASHSQLFMFCLRAARCNEKLIKEREDVSMFTIIEDLSIGLVAIVARTGVTIWRFRQLFADGQSRAPIVQTIACVLSFLHWIVRNFVLRHKCELPLTKLGGSTAIVDATSAVMLAYASPPLFVSAAGRFDSTARMLVALLISTITVPRCIFASACCGLMLAFTSEDMLQESRCPLDSSTLTMQPVEEYRQRSLRAPRFENAKSMINAEKPVFLAILALSMLMWLFQAASVGALMADIFCMPLAFSMHRVSTGDISPTAVALFFTLNLVGLPQLLNHAVRVARSPLHEP